MGGVECFDVINVGAATPEDAAEDLKKKLCVGGILIAPVCGEGGAQVMRAFHKLPDGSVLEEVKARLSVRFVPLTNMLRGHEEKEDHERRSQSEQEEVLSPHEIPESIKGSQIPSQDSFQEPTIGAAETLV